MYKENVVCLNFFYNCFNLPHELKPQVSGERKVKATLAF